MTKLQRLQQTAADHATAKQEANRVRRNLAIANRNLSNFEARYDGRMNTADDDDDRRRLSAAVDRLAAELASVEARRDALAAALE